MPYAIVVLDFKGYSDLPVAGQEAVFTELIPEVCKLIDGRKKGARPTERPFDANTWGDAILTVFRNVASAAQFALDLRHLVTSHPWKELSLRKLAVRIAIHVADLKHGTDHIRNLAIAGHHVYGAQMVVPARIEPRVAPNQIWVTKEAKVLVETALKDLQLRGRLRVLGPVRLAKSAGVRRLYWLGGEQDPPPSVAEDETEGLISQQNLGRLTSLGAMKESVDIFRVVAAECQTQPVLWKTFKDFHMAALLPLRLRAGEGRGGQVDADVLELMADGRIEMRVPGTNAENHLYVPKDMAVTVNQTTKRFEEPKGGDGVAAYCVWANTNGRRGVAIAPDVQKSTRVEFHRRTSGSDPSGVGTYVPEDAGAMFRPPPSGRTPCYRSLMSAAILYPWRARADPLAPAEMRCVGILNITCSNPIRFTHQDCAWADTAASILGSLYQAYATKRDALKEDDKTTRPSREATDTPDQPSRR